MEDVDHWSAEIPTPQNIVATDEKIGLRTRAESVIDAVFLYNPMFCVGEIPEKSTREYAIVSTNVGVP